MANRIVPQLITRAAMLGICMENPERAPANNLAAEANANALRALRQSEKLEARLQRVEEQLQAAAALANAYEAG